LRIARDGTLLYVNAAGLSQLPEWHLQAGRCVPSIMRDVVSEAMTSEKVRLLNLEHCWRMYQFFVAPIAGAGYANLYGRDITDRKQAEEEIQASREQMCALARRLQEVREEERTQIAREIHDELGGALTGLKIDFSLLTRAALKIENETVRTSLLDGMDSMMKFIDATIQTVRRIAMELRPGVLDDLGLVAALEWQIKDFEKRTGIHSEWISSVEHIDIDADLSTALFRIFQEALTNVARHSGATEVRVCLREDVDSFILEVEDNGKGIEKKKALSSKSLGLLGMRERAQIFGGRVTVTGTPGRGTKVTVEISLAEKRKMDRDQGGNAG
jgi:signal transduction histidine kinase